MTKVNYIIYLLIINLISFLIVTFLAILSTRNYLSQLPGMGLIIITAIAISYCFVGFLFFLGRRIDKWSEKDDFDLYWRKLKIWVIIILVFALFMYIVILPYFSILMDPFKLSAFNPFLSLIYSLWWFLSFVFTLSVFLNLLDSYI